MKYPATMLALLITINCAATNYYFSSTTGNDSHSTTQAQSPATPWRSIIQLNAIAASLLPGDSILFKCGDQFFGTIIPAASGNNTRHIIYSSYGNGNKPIITGFTDLNAWINKGNQLWEATLAGQSQVKMVIISGAPKAMGRYPNYNTTDGGFLSIDSYDGAGTVSNNTLSFANNSLVNGELVIRKNRWVIDRDKIISNSGKAIKGVNSSGYHPLNGFKFFIQNHISTLDQQDEWYHDAASNKLYIFSTKDPKDFEIKATSIDNLVLIQSRSFLTFKNLSLQGGNDMTVRLENAGDILFSDCDILYAGKDAINGTLSNNISILQSNISLVNNNAIAFDKFSSGTTISNNSIKKVAVVAGMGASGDHTYHAIYACGNGLTVDNNVIDEIGYVAVRFEGNDVLIKNNYITNFLTVKDDGAAIYTWKGIYNNWNSSNRKVVGNVVLYGKGQAFGGPANEQLLGTGIYIDDNVGNVEITGNTVAYCSYAGLYIHNSYNLQIYNNTFFDNASQVLLGHDNIAPDSPIRNLDFTENVLYCKTASQLTLAVRTIKDDVKDFGHFDNNYYNNPNEPDFNISVWYRRNGQDLNQLTDVAGWRSIFGLDQSSKKSQLLLLPTVMVKKAMDNKIANGSFNSNIQNTSNFSSANDCTLSWDANNNLNGGALKVSVNNTALANKIFVFVQLKNVRANTKHMVKFSISGKETLEPAQVFFRELFAPYTEITDRRRLRISAQKNDYTLYFETSKAANEGWLVFELHDPQGPVFLDNIEVREIEADEVIPNTNIRFEYNVAQSSKNITLEKSHVDGKGNFLTGVVALPSFTSKVLMENHFAILTPEHLRISVTREQLNLVELLCESQGAGPGDQYEMQRSDDGTNFSTIKNITANARFDYSKNDASTSFNYTDNVSNIERKYYRVKKTNETGKSLYSNVVSSAVKSTGGKTISVYPNPARNQISITLIKQHTASKLTIFNPAGTVVHSSDVQPDTERCDVDITNLGAGFHTVRLANADNMFTYKFIKLMR